MMEIIRLGNSGYFAKPMQVARTDLLKIETHTAIRNVVIPEFRDQMGISDLSKAGFRLVIESPSANAPGDVMLFCGRSVPSPNPQEWRSSKPRSLKPGRQSVFVDECINAFEYGRSETRFGNRLHDGMMRSFGAAELDGKADFHFLAIPELPFETLLDDDCNRMMWLDLFATAQKIFEKTYRKDGPARYIADFGLGYQRAPRAYFDVQCFADYMPMPSLFPERYGFVVTDAGIVRLPRRGMTKTQRQVARIIDYRRTLEGYDDETVMQRRSCDHGIFSGLKAISDTKEK